MPTRQLVINALIQEIKGKDPKLHQILDAMNRDLNVFRSASEVDYVKSDGKKLDIQTGLQNADSASADLNVHKSDDSAHHSPVTLGVNNNSLLKLKGQELTLGPITSPTLFGPSGSNHKSGLVPDPGSVAGVDKYLREDATWAIPPVASLVTYFLYTTASDIGGYKKMLSAHSVGGEQNVDAAGLTDTGIIEEFATDAGAPGLDFLNDGLWHLHVHALKTAGTKDATLYFEAYTRTSGGVETLRATSHDSATLTGIDSPYDLSIITGEIDVATTDRIVIKVRAHVTGAGTAPTVRLHIEGDSFARLEFPGTPVASGSGTPGGADTYVQFNDGGNFGGVAAFTFTKASGALQLTGTQLTLGAFIAGRQGSDNASDPFLLQIGKSRGTVSAPTGLSSGDSIASLDLFGRHSGGAFNVGASIKAKATANWTGITAHGTELQFWTSPDSGADLTQNMTLSKDGNLGLGSTAPTDKLVLKRATSGSMRLLVGNRDGHIQAYNGWDTQKWSSLEAYSDGTNTDYSALIIASNRASGFLGGLMYLNANIGSEGTNDWRLAQISCLTDGANNSGYLSLQTMNAGTLAERLKIDKAGKVTIATGALDMNTHLINNVTNPSSAQDAATKAYVDGLIADRGKNFIDNGNFNVWQRGTTTVTGITNGTYHPDRWLFTLSGSSAVFDSVADATPPTVAQSGIASALDWKLDCTTADAAVAAGDLIGIQTKIESLFIQGLFGKVMTLSFWVKSTKTGIHCVAFKNDGAALAGGYRSYVAEYTVNVSDTWEYKTVTFTMDAFDATKWPVDNSVTKIGLQVFFTMMAGSTYQGTANTWNASNVMATANQVNDADNTANNFQISQVQLEIASVATKYEVVHPGVELARCQRYLFCVLSNATNTRRLVGIGWAYSTTDATICLKPPTTFVSVPTLTATGSDWELSDVINTTAITAIAIRGASLQNPDWLVLQATVASGLTAFRPMEMRADNTAGRLLILTAEL